MQAAQKSRLKAARQIIPPSEQLMRINACAFAQQ
jgi:hypothetical protein